MTPRARASLVASVVEWFEHSQRDLPWRKINPRTTKRDPYRSLVSEIMLQQTQVSRVLEKFDPFLNAFPTLDALAAANEHEVLRAWTGLGYYRRARSLHAAAKAIVGTHASKVPAHVAALMDLPGVGRYTAGAIASIVFDKPEPIVDGNVVRVLFRVHGKDLPANDAAGVAWAWDEAAKLVTLGPPALFNEGLMELGAMVCTPALPKCDQCPLRRLCTAHKHGTQAHIPRPKSATKQREQWHVCVVVRDVAGRFLLERRTGPGKGKGLWEGLWQAPTIEHASEPEDSLHAAKQLLKTLRATLGVKSVEVAEPCRTFDFKTSACRVHFRAFEARLPSKGKAIAKGPGVERAWFSREQAAELPMSSPMRRLVRE